MKLMVYALYDTAVKAFNQPVFMRSAGEMSRAFMQSCQDEKSNLCIHHADYVLFHLGEYDDATGQFDCLAAPVRFMSASQCLVDPVVPPGRLPM